MRITLNNDLVEIDDEIVSGIKLINDKGWRTDFSCAGHYNSEDKYPFSFPYVSFDYLSNNRFFTLFEKVPESVFESFDVEIVIMGENDDIPIFPTWADIEIDIGEKLLTGKFVNSSLDQTEPYRQLVINVKSLKDITAIREKNFGLTGKMYSVILRSHNEKEMRDIVDEDIRSESSKERFMHMLFQFRTGLYELANELPNIRS